MKSDGEHRNGLKHTARVRNPQLPDGEIVNGNTRKPLCPNGFRISLVGECGSVSHRIVPIGPSSVFRDPSVVFAGCQAVGVCSVPPLHCRRSVTSHGSPRPQPGTTSQ